MRGLRSVYESVAVRTYRASGAPARVLPADDHDVAWRGSGRVLGGQPEPRVMGEVSGGREASSGPQPAARLGALGRYRAGNWWPRCPWRIMAGIPSSGSGPVADRVSRICLESRRKRAARRRVKEQANVFAKSALVRHLAYKRRAKASHQSYLVGSCIHSGAPPVLFI